MKKDMFSKMNSNLARLRRILLSTALILLPNSLQASWSDYKPHSSIAQTAAYAGLFAAGIGYEWKQTWAFDVLYGYTPAEYAGRVVQSWAMKNSAYLFRFQGMRPYLGLNILYSPDGGLFVRLPNQYPDFYYPPSAIRPAFITGLELDLHADFKVGLEYAVLDSELAYYRDTNSFSAEKMGSGGMSLRWLIH